MSTGEKFESDGQTNRQTTSAWQNLGSEVAFAGSQPERESAKQESMEHELVDSAIDRIEQTRRTREVGFYYQCLRDKSHLGKVAESVEATASRQIVDLDTLLRVDNIGQFYDLAALEKHADFEDRKSREYGKDAHRAAGEQANTQYDAEGGYQADALEALLVLLIGQGQILQDAGARPEDQAHSRSDADPRPMRRDFKIETRVLQHTRYDDYVNKVDLPIAITTQNIIKGDPSPQTWYAAIDATVMTNELEMRRKLDRDTNDRELAEMLPDGFTDVCYAIDPVKTEPEEHFRTLHGVPHYRIALSAMQVDHLLLMGDPQADPKALDGYIRSQLNGRTSQMEGRTPAPITPGMCRDLPAVQFKILHEISMQNSLFETDLYDKEDAGKVLSSDEEKCKVGMECLDQPLLQELDYWADREFALLFSRQRLKEAQDANLDRVKIVSDILRYDDWAYDTLLRQVGYKLDEKDNTKKDNAQK